MRLGVQARSEHRAPWGSSVSVYVTMAVFAIKIDVAPGFSASHRATARAASARMTPPSPWRASRELEPSHTGVRCPSRPEVSRKLEDHVEAKDAMRPPCVAAFTLRCDLSVREHITFARGFSRGKSAHRNTSAPGVWVRRLGRLAYPDEPYLTAWPRHPYRPPRLARGEGTPMKNPPSTNARAFVFFLGVNAGRPTA